MKFQLAYNIRRLLFTGLAVFSVSVARSSVQPSDVIIYDPLDGLSLGTLVGNPPPAFVPGVFGQGAQPLRQSIGAAIRYSIQPPASGTILFWVKVAAPIEFYRGINIGFYGREAGICNDFFMQLQSDGGLNVAILSGAGGTFFRDVFPQPLLWRVGEIHHLAVTWGTGVNPQLYIDGVQFRLSGGSLPYVERCGSATAPFLFTTSRESLLQETHSPGPFVFDDFALLNRPLSASEVNEVFTNGQLPPNDNCADAIAEIARLSAELQAVLAANQALQAENTALTNQLSAANAQIATLTIQTQQLTQQIDTITVSLESLRDAFRSVFNDPNFTISGTTLEEQVQNLVVAINNLSKGQKKALYKNLGGK